MRVVAALSVAFVVLVGVVAVTYPNESDEVRQRNAAFMKLGDGDTPGGLKADPEQGDTNQVTICLRDDAGFQACGIILDIDPGFDGVDMNSVDVCFKDAAGNYGVTWREDGAGRIKSDRDQRDIEVDFDTNDFHDDNDDGYLDKASSNSDSDLNDMVFNACGILPYLDVEPPSFDAVCQDLNQISRIVESLDAKNPVAADLRTALERTQNNLKDVIIVSAANYHHAGGGILGSCGLVMDGEDAGDGDFWGSNRES